MQHSFIPYSKEFLNPVAGWKCETQNWYELYLQCQSHGLVRVQGCFQWNHSSEPWNMSKCWSSTRMHESFLQYSLSKKKSETKELACNGTCVQIMQSWNLLLLPWVQSIWWKICTMNRHFIYPWWALSAVSFMLYYVIHFKPLYQQEELCWRQIKWKKTSN